MTENPLEILIIEDDIYSVEFMIDALEENGPSDRIKVLRTGAEALDYLCSGRPCPDDDSFRRPRLIFLDLNLPLVSGLQVLQKIRDTETTAAIPVVVFTSSANERDRIESYRLGANSFVVKPHTYEKFVQAVVEIAFYWTRINRVSYLEA